MAVYNHYTVLGSKITVQPYNISTGTSNYLAIGLTAGGIFATMSTTEDILQSRLFSSHKMITGSSIGTIPKFYGMKRYFSAKKFFGKKTILGDSLYRGDVNNNPTESAFYHVVALPCSNTTGGTFQTLITIDYIVCFTEPRDLATS